MPRKYNRKKKNTTTPPPPPPPPEMDSTAFQTAISAAVTAALAHINNNCTNGGGNGNGTWSSNQGDNQGHQRTCTYKDLTNGKPMPFNRIGGVIALTRWFEKFESVFEICDCPGQSKVKFVACTFSDRVLSWWNVHVKALTLPVANSMVWEDLKTMMLDEYFPRGEVQKLEQELWNLTVKDSNIEAYIARFNDLALLCLEMITSKSNKVERFIWGLTPPIQGNVIAAKPATFDSAKRLAQKLYDHGE